MTCFALIWFFYPILSVSSQSLPLLLLVSFDGFRHDYREIYGPLKNFQRLEQQGVRAHSLTPTFTTLSIPNHYTLITGLYQEVHGLISDEFFDRDTRRIFSSWENASEEWWPSETIWTLNEKRKDARSGVIGWPQQGIHVKRSEPFQKERTFRETIDRILSWFNDPSEPINFGAIYSHEPASSGYQKGPFSSLMNRTVHQCDEDLGYLLDQIQKNVKLRNNLHLIITSAHGMERVNGTDHPIFLEDYLNMQKIDVFGSSTLWHIFLKSKNDLIEMKSNLSRIPHAEVFRRDEFPRRFHYQHRSRLGDLILLVQPGYEVRRERRPTDQTWKTTHGNVGYDNELDAMKSIFYASGPLFKENYLLPSSQTLINVDLFPLMCSLLNLHPCPPSNGSISNIQSFLTDPFRTLNLTEKEVEKSHDGPMGLVIYLLVLVSFVLILIMAVVWSAVSFRHGTTFLRTAQTDPNASDEQNQYKFTQINDMKLNSAIGNDNL